MVLCAESTAEGDNALRLFMPGLRDALCSEDAATYSAVGHARQDAPKDFVLDPPRTGDRRQLASATVDCLGPRQRSMSDHSAATAGVVHHGPVGAGPDSGGISFSGLLWFSGWGLEPTTRPGTALESPGKFSIS